jgi:hypothetical protein
MILSFQITLICLATAACPTADGSLEVTRTIRRALASYRVKREVQANLLIAEAVPRRRIMPSIFALARAIAVSKTR